MRVLLTGASGFVGSHVLRHLLVNTDWDVVCPVTFRHKGIPARLHSALDGQELHRVTTVMLDLRAPVDSVTLRSLGPIDVIMNVASESHVDRSIARPREFIDNNVQLMTGVLDLARRLHPRLLLQMSTDEVYGPAPDDYRHTEWDPVIPSNPYSASKAAQEAVCVAYWRTYGVPVVITNTMNIIGEMQDPEKFVPLIIRNLRDGKPVPVHVRADGRPGSRFYLHARNLADAWLYLITQYLDPPYAETGTWADPGQKTRLFPEIARYADGADRPDRYNIVGEQEIDNIDMVRRVALAMNLPEVPEAMLDRTDFHSTRPGHDPRYALEGTRLRVLGWRAPLGLDESLARTVRWYLENPDWLDL